MHTQLSRDQLHEEVWAEPMTKVAARYGISDVALKKICKKHRIPTPSRGYWAKIAAGKKVKKTHYRSLENSSLNTITISAGYTGLSPQAATKVRQAMKKESGEAQTPTGNKGDAEGLHALAVHTQSKLANKSTGPNGFIHLSFNSHFRIKITPACVERLVNFLDLFCREAENRGHSFEKSEDGLRLCANGRVYPFEIFEKTDRYSHRPSEKEAKALERWQEEQKQRSIRLRIPVGNLMEFGRPYIPEWDYVPNGKLAFRLLDGQWDGMRRTFGDGKTQRIENMIGKIFAGITGIEVAKKERAKQAAIQDAERQNRRKIAEEQAKVEALQKFRIEKLEELAEALEKHRLLLQAISEVERRFCAPEDAPETQEWLSWAKGYAESIDPLGSSAPRLLQLGDLVIKPRHSGW